VPAAMLMDEQSLRNEPNLSSMHPPRKLGRFSYHLESGAVVEVICVQFDDLAKKGAYTEPCGYTGKKLGTAYHFISSKDQTVKRKYRGNSKRGE